MTRTSSVPALALLAAMASAPAARAEEAVPLQGAAAWQTLVGNTVVARTGTGAAYTDYYAPDGTIRHQDGDGTTAGRWALEGDRVCLDYPDDDDRVCVAVTVTGRHGSYTEAGGEQDTFDVLAGNAKGL